MDTKEGSGTSIVVARNYRSLSSRQEIVVNKNIANLGGN